MTDLDTAQRKLYAAMMDLQNDPANKHKEDQVIYWREEVKRLQSTIILPSAK